MWLPTRPRLTILRTGYIPAGYSLDQADVNFGYPTLKNMTMQVLDSMVQHVQAILDLKAKGRHLF